MNDKGTCDVKLTQIKWIFLTFVGDLLKSDIVLIFDKLLGKNKAQMWYELKAITMHQHSLLRSI